MSTILTGCSIRADSSTPGQEIAKVTEAYLDEQYTISHQKSTTADELVITAAIARSVDQLV
ncbi:MAG: hypothetical protein ACYTES_13165, partial [Planctomycetota bacterium]